MHKYLKAIGYGNISTRKKLNTFLKEMEEHYSSHELISVETESDFCMNTRKSAEQESEWRSAEIWIWRKNFFRQYYYPYFIGSGISSYADISVEKRMDREAYVGICEDVKVGISLFFHLQNVLEYMKENQLSGGSMKFGSVTLSGLCNSGTVLFPVLKTKELEKRSREESRNRMMLLSAARNGDQTAMESLTLDDIDIYSKSVETSCDRRCIQYCGYIFYALWSGMRQIFYSGRNIGTAYN